MFNVGSSTFMGTNVELSTSNVERRTSNEGRMVQELPGHKDVATTPIYTHVMQRPGIGVRSPLEG